MIRKIICIDEEKCNGCGLCANACHEGAIEILDGKARLTRDEYCDGFGDCLPACPAGAITFEEREAASYDAEAVEARKRQKAQNADVSCPGMRARRMDRNEAPREAAQRASQLRQWPTQIKLMPIKAPYYDGARLLVAADCTAFAYASMHEDFMRGRITINGCPKLDAVDYTEKLRQIIAQNDIREVMIARMQVPCCGGLEMAARRAVQLSGKSLPVSVAIVSVEGNIVKWE